MKFNKQMDTIFLDPHCENFQINERVNVILSPALYWVKKVQLPVKYLRDVKALLPSLFEDTLPEGVYSYSAYKSGEYFYIFAYEDKLILDTLTSKGISLAEVNSVNFAQSEFPEGDAAIKINDSKSLYQQDDLLVLVPSDWVSESRDLDLSTISLSKNSITLKQFGHIVNDKALYTIATLLILLIGIVGAEYFMTLQKIATTSALKEELFQKNGLKATMMQNRSMLKKQQEIHSTQSTLRETISTLLYLSLQKEESLSFVGVKGKRLMAEFSGMQNARAVAMKDMFKSKNMKFSSHLKNNIWHVEIEL